MAERKLVPAQQMNDGASGRLEAPLHLAKDVVGERLRHMLDRRDRIEDIDAGTLERELDAIVVPEIKPFSRQAVARDALARMRDHARRHVEPDDLRHAGAPREGLHDVADARTDLHDGCVRRDFQPREKVEDLVDVTLGAACNWSSGTPSWISASTATSDRPDSPRLKPRNSTFHKRPFAT